MPLGDPHGGEFTYTDEGLPLNIRAVTVPVKNMDDSIEFYAGLLGFRIEEEGEKRTYLVRGDAHLILEKSANTGIDTGIYFGVDNPYDLHRRLIDEGVVFVRDPLDSPIGVYTSFRDCSGNVVHAVDSLGKV